MNDTLTFSGVLYKPKNVVVTSDIIQPKTLTISLSRKINTLGEVVVGKLLTGDLTSDIANSGVKRDLDFYDLGIPGHTGKVKTQTERRLFTAGDFKAIHLMSILGGSLPVEPILNAISGRTKLLKDRVQLEKQEKCLDKIKSDLAETLFGTHSLEEQYREGFFYFCTDDSQFDTLCIMKDNFEIFQFLEQKLLAYKETLQID